MNGLFFAVIVIILVLQGFSVNTFDKRNITKKKN